jgi:hypothetical protein
MTATVHDLTDNPERAWREIQRTADWADVVAAMNRVVGLPDNASGHDRGEATPRNSMYDPRFNDAAHVAAYLQVLADRDAGVTPTLCTPDTVTTTWEDDKHSYSESVDKTVRLSGVPPITVRGDRSKRLKGGEYGVYSIKFRFVRFAPNADWQTTVTIYAQSQGDIVGAFFKPEDVVDAPQWLADVIASATPDA